MNSEHSSTLDLESVFPPLYPVSISCLDQKWAASDLLPAAQPFLSFSLLSSSLQMPRLSFSALIVATLGGQSPNWMIFAIDNWISVLNITKKYSSNFGWPQMGWEMIYSRPRGGSAGYFSPFSNVKSPWEPESATVLDWAL